jgi:hypothetical protein
LAIFHNKKEPDILFMADSFTLMIILLLYDYELTFVFNTIDIYQYIVHSW